METQNCPICLDLLVAPISWCCGHNVCIMCDRRMTSGKCALCRAPLSKVRKVNLLLENLLMCNIPDYTKLAALRTKNAERFGVIEKYKKSTRYSSVSLLLSDLIEESIMTKDHLLSIIESSPDFSIKITLEEVEYVLSRRKCLIVKDQWILPHNRHKIVETFLKQHQDELTTVEKMNIISHFSPVFRQLAGAVKWKFPPQYFKMSGDAIDRLADHLSTMLLTPEREYKDDDSSINSSREYGDNSDSDSESEVEDVNTHLDTSVEALEAVANAAEANMAGAEANAAEDGDVAGDEADASVAEDGDEAEHNGNVLWDVRT